MARKREPDQLDKDVAAADAAGMSYGRYKALQNEEAERRIDPAEEKVPENVKICPWCGVLFVPRFKLRVYCSDKCKGRATEARRRERELAETK